MFKTIYKDQNIRYVMVDSSFEPVRNTLKNIMTGNFRTKHNSHILHLSLLLNISLSLPESIRKQTQFNVFSSLRIDLTSFKTIQGAVKTICTSGKDFEMHDDYYFVNRQYINIHTRSLEHLDFFVQVVNKTDYWSVFYK